MKISIEPTEIQNKEEIVQEYEDIYQHFISEFKEPPIKELVVPNNFDKKVNELQRTKDYQSSRGEHEALGKNIYYNSETSIVISKSVYQQTSEKHRRYQVASHEFSHSATHVTFPAIRVKSKADEYMLNMIHILYDEYFCNRMSFEVTDHLCGEATDNYKSIINTAITGFADILIHSEKHLEHLLSEISNFRNHDHVPTYIYSTQTIVDTITKSFVYLMSHADHFVGYNNLRNIPNNPFIDENAFTLSNIFASKYQNIDFDMIECLPCFSEFIKKFGLQLNDGEKLSLTVLDV